ncbi:MAG: hypothetical protein JOZ17_03495 [Acetobacteraceae bacterium]|nr:hypothetical protein [Acetobacteraceae bacterium]
MSIDTKLVAGRSRERRSSFEERRLAPLHWFFRAEKAHFSALALWSLGHDPKACIAAVGRHSGGALSEGFLREAAIALELALKAVIVQDMENRGDDTGLPENHDVPSLWDRAGLPELPREDKYRLLQLKSVLIWSGRYPTPRRKQTWDAEKKEVDALLGPPCIPGTLIFRKPIHCDWDDFDRLYSLAETQFHETYPHMEV